MSGGEKSAKYKVRHPERVKAKNARWYRRNKKKADRANAKWIAANRTRRRRSAVVHSWHKKGVALTWQEFEAQLRAQRGRCAICRRLLEDLQMDHDHKSLEFRGVLCPSCNYGLGCFKDSYRSLIRAALYILKGGARRGS